jgi:hypothetical protein
MTLDRGKAAGRIDPKFGTLFFNYVDRNGEKEPICIRRTFGFIIVTSANDTEVRWIPQSAFEAASHLYIQRLTFVAADPTRKPELVNGLER